MKFIKTLQKILKLDLILQIKNYIGHHQQEKIKKVIGLIKDKLGEKIKTEFAGLRAKTYSYLIDDGSEDKKAKDIKKYLIKKFKFETYKNCLEASEIDNKIKHLEKN